MPISDDLRSVQAVVGELAHGNEYLVSLLCANLQSLADQVEALESLSLMPNEDGMRYHREPAVHARSDNWLQ